MAVRDGDAGGGVAGEPCGVLRAGGVRVARAGAPLGDQGSAPLKALQGVYFLRRTGSLLSTPLAADLDLARRWRQDEQLDADISTPLTANFGPDPEAAAEGRSAGRGVCFLRLSPQTSGLALRGSGGARCLGAEFAFFLFFTHWPLYARQSSVAIN